MLSAEAHKSAFSGFEVAPIAQSLRIGSQMQEVRGSNPRLGGYGLVNSKPLGGINTLQTMASGLQSTTQGIPSGPPKTTTPSQNKEYILLKIPLAVNMKREYSLVSRGSPSPWNAKYRGPCFMRSTCGRPLLKGFPFGLLSSGPANRLGLSGTVEAWATDPMTGGPT